MSFATYFSSNFPVDLANFQKLSLDLAEAEGLRLPASCPHHGVPEARTAPLLRQTRRLNTTVEFWMSWYIATFFHQAIHRYFPKTESEWLERFGNHPLPMIPAGFGCWHCASPEELLRNVRIADAEWVAAQTCIKKSVIPVLRELGIDLQAFVNVVGQDRDAVADESSTLILDALLAR